MTAKDLESTRFDPEAWPKCSKCGTAYVMRRGLSFSRGAVWTFMADCTTKACRKNPPEVATKETP